MVDRFGERFHRLLVGDDLGGRLNFNNRPLPQWAAPAGFVVWMALIQVPAIGDAFEWRVVVFSTIGAFYCLLAARELWVRDGLKSRFPMALLLGFHAIVLMIRIPAVLVEAGTLAPEFGGRWFAPMALEALVFIQALAMLTLSLTKERAERRLRSMALSDPLTGLANRRAFFDQGAALIAGCVRGKRPTSLIAFDLDRLKQINNTYGHPFGDAMRVPGFPGLLLPAADNDSRMGIRPRIRP